MKSQPDYDIDREDGTQGGLLVADLVRSLSEGRVEVKTDRGFVQTGNIYVEEECRYPGRGWKPTGIANRDTAPTWVYVLRDTGVMLAAPVEVLRRLVADSRFSWPAECRIGGHPTRGHLIRLSAVFRQGALK